MRSVPMLRCHNTLRAKRLWHRGICCRYACSYCKCCTHTCERERRATGDAARLLDQHLKTYTDTCGEQDPTLLSAKDQSSPYLVLVLEVRAAQGHHRQRTSAIIHPPRVKSAGIDARWQQQPRGGRCTMRRQFC